MQTPQKTGLERLLIRQERPSSKDEPPTPSKLLKRSDPTETEERPKPHRKTGNLTALWMCGNDDPFHLRKVFQEIRPESFVPQVRYAVVTDQQKTHLHTINGPAR